MALVKGTNCGFLLATPSGNPLGNDLEVMDTLAWSLKDTAPVGATKVTEIGWWCDNATEEANFEVGIYDHNVGDNNPEAKVGDFSTTNAKGTDAGWKKVTGLNIPITAGTIYWIAVQLDDTATTTNICFESSDGDRMDRKVGQTTLTDPWGASTSLADNINGIYAITDAPAPDPATATPNTAIISSMGCAHG